MKTKIIIVTPKPIERFLESTCELAHPLPIFMGIYELSYGMPCIGCAYDGFGEAKDKCEAKKTIFASASKPETKEEPAETVREMATRLGISLSEARRRRRIV